MALPGKRNLRIAIEKHGGIVAEIAAHFNKSRQTIYNWLDHYNMRPLLTEARQDMREVAQDVVYQRLMSDEGDKSWDAAKFVLMHLQGDGEPIAISPETRRLLADLGLSVAGFMADFEQLVIEQAEAATPHLPPPRIQGGE